MKTEKDYQIKAAFKELDRYLLNNGTAAFIKSLKKEYGRSKKLTDKQMKALIEIRDNHAKIEANTTIVKNN